MIFCEQIFIIIKLIICLFVNTYYQLFMYIFISYHCKRDQYKLAGF